MFSLNPGTGLRDLELEGAASSELHAATVVKPATESRTAEGAEVSSAKVVLSANTGTNETKLPDSQSVQQSVSAEVSSQKSQLPFKLGKLLGCCCLNAASRSDCM